MKQIFIIVLGVFLVWFCYAYGWHKTFHEKVTEHIISCFMRQYNIDVLKNLDFQSIVFNAWEADISPTERHCEHFAHAVTFYQSLLNSYGKVLYFGIPLLPVVICTLPGAEIAAGYHLREAREAYQTKKYKKASEELGYAIHYIEDALCPAHVYPFKQGLPDVHGDFESWADKNLDFWLKVVEEETGVTNIDSPEYLAALLKSEADWIATLPHRYRAPDDEIRGILENASGTWITRETGKGELLWKMRQQDLAEIVRKITRHVRGAVLYVVGEKLPSGPLAGTQVTTSILVIDVSGSMLNQWKGGVKIESAKKAALQFIEQVTNEPRGPGSLHLVGVVTFGSDAYVVCPLTTDYAAAKKGLEGVWASRYWATNLGAGLDAALKELDKVSSGKRFIILLTDGIISAGKSPDAVLATSVTEARAKGICIHTVGFGDPNDLDENFLKKVSLQSGCGTYNYASSGFELFGTYIKVRHAMLGSNRIVDFSSGPQPVRMLPGQTATLGAFQLTAPAKELHFTLAWSEPGRMNVVLVDPTNQKVTSSYPGAQIYSGNGFVHVTVFSPKTGIWRASAAALSSFVSGVQYYGVASARTGGFVIPYQLPIPCFDIAGTQICIPLPDMPTVLIVIGSVAFLCWVIYTRLTSP
ncbi:MAG: VWA domain-containing protein [Candidatus Bathyarchaeia archaeon]